jgi:hypothetical protein
MSDPKKSPEVKPELAQPQLQAATQQQVVDIASAVSKSTLEAILPQLIASLKQGQAPAPAQKPRHKSIFSRPKCSECGWFLKDGETSHEHESVVVYPTRMPEYGDEFAYHGIKISGVKFCSDHENHAILVPKGLKSTLLEAVQNWEQAEKEMRNGKDKRRRGPSAVVSPSGARTNPVAPDSAIGWQ